MKYNEYLRLYMIERYKRRRAEAIAKLGGKCAECDSTEELQFDHKDRDTKFKTIARMWSYSEERFWKEIVKCQLLCGEHHHQKTCEDMGWVFRPKNARRNRRAKNHAS